MLLASDSDECINESKDIAISEINESKDFENDKNNAPDLETQIDKLFDIRQYFETLKGTLSFKTFEQKMKYQFNVIYKYL